MFIIHWMFDKLGYMPKIDMQVGKVNIEAAWPFPAEKEIAKKQGKKPAVKKPAVKKTTKKVK
jgi:hypothetical protein